ncbi:NADH dehydrogenase subunit 6 (mitochondrion) [Vespa mandarinia]|uniref:NADH dehydrogenase subunit 6 n=1 Tax=Vespa mandarinia TaxID=7446 RepID=A0A7G1HFY1_VESMA|nr:NADH dehydrogenase subunit 6 [Vespa mandarinia]BCD56253.1 NADH dehydrogenase subunit 6 [Vespa mandarinia]BCD56292.1 NADH dehydrogenase subunit 6 [Vespa mandarinia]
MLKSMTNSFCFLMLLILLYFILHPQLSIIQSMTLLMLFTVYTCLSLSAFFTFSLYSFLIFLMIIGGLMILFMMFLSLISNQYMPSKWKSLFLPMSIILPLLIMTIISQEPSLMNLNMNYINMSVNYLFNNSSFLNLNMLLNLPFNFYVIALMFFLLFSLILITKICLINSKPLRTIKK